MTYSISQHVMTSWDKRASLCFLSNTISLKYLVDGTIPRPMAAHRLPNEIWLYIFELSTVEYLPNRELPNSMDQSAWFKNVFGDWCLRSPDELAVNAQKKRHKTVKVR